MKIRNKFIGEKMKCLCNFFLNENVNTKTGLSTKKKAMMAHLSEYKRNQFLIAKLNKL
jgi:hypothetical protein